MDFPMRKSPRIVGYDYSQANYYFITICTYSKKCIFGEPEKLNWLGQIAQEKLIQISKINPSIQINHYVVMPNHIHVILDVSESNRQNLNIVIGQYKMSVTKQIRKKIPGFRVWQRSYHDHIIRNRSGYEKIWTYIENNPLKWEEDCFFVTSE